MKIKLIYGILGFIFGALVTFFIFSPDMNNIENAEGSVGVNCPGVKYSSGQLIISECEVRPGSICTYEDRGGCEYIMRNIGKAPIKQGDQIQVIWVQASKNGATFMDVEVPTG